MGADFILDSPVAYGSVAAVADYDATVGASIGTASAAGTVIYKRCTGVCGLKVGAVGIVITAAVTGATAPVLTVYARPTVNTNTLQRTIGTITVPVTAIVGDVYFCVFSSDNINVNPGEEISVEVTTKGAALGSGFISACFQPFLVGPTSGGTTASPVSTIKPFGATKVGTIKLLSSGATAQ